MFITSAMIKKYIYSKLSIPRRVLFLIRDLIVKDVEQVCGVTELKALELFYPYRVVMLEAPIFFLPYNQLPAFSADYCLFDGSNLTPIRPKLNKIFAPFREQQIDLVSIDIRNIVSYLLFALAIGDPFHYLFFSTPDELRGFIQNQSKEDMTFRLGPNVTEHDLDVIYAPYVERSENGWILHFCVLYSKLDSRYHLQSWRIKIKNNYSKSKLFRETIQQDFIIFCSKVPALT